MTIQDLGSIGELVGAVATVATLLYLAVQIRGLSALIERVFQSQIGPAITIYYSNDRNVEVSKAMAIEESKTIVVGGVVSDDLGQFFNRLIKAAIPIAHAANLKPAII